MAPIIDVLMSQPTITENQKERFYLPLIVSAGTPAWSSHCLARDPLMGAVAPVAFNRSGAADSLAAVARYTRSISA